MSDVTLEQKLAWVQKTLTLYRRMYHEFRQAGPVTDELAGAVKADLRVGAAILLDYQAQTQGELFATDGREHGEFQRHQLRCD